MLVLFVFLLWVDSHTLAQFPDAETCRFNVGEYQELLKRITKDFDDQGVPLDPAFSKGIQRDTDIWYHASLMQLPFGRPDVRFKAQQELLELLGYERFQLGLMPPVFIKPKTLKEGIN